MFADNGCGTAVSVLDLFGSVRDVEGGRAIAGTVGGAPQREESSAIAST
ncbi:hypothetical protein ACVIVD_003439 [Bradyrhizobium liaoningense]